MFPLERFGGVLPYERVGVEHARGFGVRIDKADLGATADVADAGLDEVGPRQR